MKSFHYHSRIKDTIAVQKRRNSVNDDEEHEENPHLEDFLVTHHCGDADAPSSSASDDAKLRPTLLRPSLSILHNTDCPSRHSCELTESKRRISFHQVTVRDYDMVLGDHPNCSYGPPVALGWHYTEYEPLDLNEYEFHHSRRRPLRQLMLNYFRRVKILEGENSEDEIKKATKEANRAMMQRTITRHLLCCWRIFDAVESVGRKIKRAAKRERTSKRWNDEDELDWTVHGESKSILKKI